MANEHAMKRIADLARDIQKINLWQWVRFHSGDSTYCPGTVLMKVMKARDKGPVTLNYPGTVTKK